MASKFKHSLLASAIAATLLFGGSVAFGQAGKSTLPPIYNQFRIEPGFEIQSSGIQRKIAERAIEWAFAANELDLPEAAKLISYPFYVEGRLARNADGFATALRQWHALNSFKEFREHQWKSTAVAIFTLKEWLGYEDNAKRYGDTVATMELGPDAYVVYVYMTPDHKPYSQPSQAYYMRLSGGTPTIAGVWDYKPPVYEN
jgi:hypothetical protein